MELKRVSALLLCLILVLSMLAGCGKGSNNASNTPAGNANNAAETNAANNSNNVQPSGPAVSEADMEKLKELITAGLEAVGAEKLNEGKYDISVLSASDQFKIKESKLMVVGNAMQLVLTVDGDTYSKLFAGKAEDAAKATDAEKAASVINGEKNPDGSVTFRVPVKELNEVIDLAAYADEYGKWFDRPVLAEASSLDSSAIKQEDSENDEQNTGKDNKLADGEYTIDITCSGGTGRGGITSPARVFVKDGKYTLEITMTSSTYDYARVKGIKYYNVNPGGLSQFKFPVTSLSGSLPVSADTTAMSKPYEVDYVITFDPDSLTLVSGRTDDGKTQHQPAAQTPADEPADEPSDEPGDEPAEETLADGTYDITIDKSKMYMFAMYNQDKEKGTAPGKLIVKDGKMTAVITYNGTSAYGKMYVGDSTAAASSAEADWIMPVSDGTNDTFTLPVTELDKEIKYSSWSNKNSKWVDQVIIFKSEGMTKAGQ